MLGLFVFGVSVVMMLFGCWYIVVESDGGGGVAVTAVAVAVLLP